MALGQHCQGTPRIRARTVVHNPHHVGRSCAQYLLRSIQRSGRNLTMTERNRILLRAAAILTVAAALLCLYLGVLSLGMPMPRCAFLEVTGWQCPGCGSQRALAALLHGHPLEAWRYNLMLPPALAMILLLWLLPQGSRLKERLTRAPPLPSRSVSRSSGGYCATSSDMPQLAQKPELRSEIYTKTPNFN